MPPSSSVVPALRRTSSIILVVSFVAMATSGAAMLLVEGLAFQLRMHPVHNVFGLAMVAAGLVHTALNWRPLVAHLRGRRAQLLGGVLAGLLVLLYAAGLGRSLDEGTVRQVDEILAAARAKG
jgi:hypothetical protein